MDYLFLKKIQIMKQWPLILLTFLLLFSSCIVRAPKYSTVEKVFVLKLGQTKEEVSQVLGIPPYNVVSVYDTGTVLLYKYRVTDRATLPFLLKETNGKKVRGKYVNLIVAYDTNGRVVYYETCSECDKTIEEKNKLDIDKIVSLITVTLPALLIFLGLKSTQ